jgi:hypothetical protein
MKRKILAIMAFLYIITGITGCEDDKKFEKLQGTK